MYEQSSFAPTTSAPTTRQKSYWKAPIISLRMVRETTIELPRHITSPRDIVDNLSARFAEFDREVLVAVYLDVKSRIIAVEQVHMGGIDYCPAYARDIVKGALLCNASSVILAHNHPSGDPTPSPEDVNATKRIREALELMDMRLLDHIVLGDTVMGIPRFVSLRERGLGF